MSKQSIIIIGAGAAGLIAANELFDAFDVTILEARPYIGGRMQSVLMNGRIIEAGAEFVHGKLPVTLGLLKKAGIDYVKIEGGMYRKKEGRFTNVEEMTEGWEGLLKRMDEVEHDMTLKELLEEYYPGQKNELLRQHVRSYSEGFDLADIDRVSVKALNKEWNAEGDDSFRIPAGYSALSKYLREEAEKKGAVFYTGIIVKNVEWAPGKVTVYAENRKAYLADKLLVTVPVSILQNASSKAAIHFKPPLNFDEQAAENIGYGTVIKIVLKFKNAFWQKDAGFILSDELFPTWWTQLPDEVPLLTGWLGGPKASALSNETDETLIKKALASLALIYDTKIASLKEELEEWMIFNWQKNEYAKGAYSYETIKSESAKKIISTPVSGTIFFAGEALYTGDHPGTVEAALVSGIDMANEIKKT